MKTMDALTVYKKLNVSNLPILEWIVASHHDECREETPQMLIKILDVHMGAP
jgi:hypothetical protein